jgi:hypothetical protein
MIAQLQGRFKQFLRQHLLEELVLERASMRVSHKRPSNWIMLDDVLVPDPDSYFKVDDDETVFNQKTNVGIVQLHLQGYGTSGLATNGFNWIALTNTAVTPAAGDTTLTGEISANGLSRAQGTVVLPTGSGTQTTVDKTFTCATAPQAAQAAALFNASSSGVMNHELTFTQRSLQIGDTLEITYTITLS